MKLERLQIQTEALEPDINDYWDTFKINGILKYEREVRRCWIHTFEKVIFCAAEIKFEGWSEDLYCIARNKTEFILLDECE